MPLKYVVTTTSMADEIIATPKTESSTTSTSNLPTVHDESAPIASYLGISDPSDSAKAKLTTITDYLRNDKKEYSDIDLLTDLKGTMFKLGNPPIGTSQLDFLYNYAKLDSQIMNLQKQKQEFVR